VTAPALAESQIWPDQKYLLQFDGQCKRRERECISDGRKPIPSKVASSSSFCEGDQRGRQEEEGKKPYSSSGHASSPFIGAAEIQKVAKKKLEHFAYEGDDAHKTASSCVCARSYPAVRMEDDAATKCTLAGLLACARAYFNAGGDAQTR